MQFNRVQRNFLAMIRALTLALLFSGLLFGKVTKSILKEEPDELVIQLRINARTESDLFPTRMMVGLPSADIPITDIQFEQRSQIPFQTEIVKNNKSFAWSQQQQIQNLETAILTIYPLDNTGNYFQMITIRLKFDTPSSTYRQSNRTETMLLENRVINWTTAKKWIHKDPRKIQ